MTHSSVRQASGPASSWIDRHCDQFEKDWREGRNPRIEEILAGLPDESHPKVLRELLAVEIELRRRRGDEIERHEYEERFPNAGKVLDDFAASFSLHMAATVPLTETGTAPASATTSARYHDLKFFRRGGLGALYRAMDESLHRETVVKFMNDRCHADPTLVAQFRVEAEVTSRLDHPGIVPVYGIGQDWQGRPFYVMRLIHGRELKQAIQEYHLAGGPNRRGRGNREQLFTLLEHLASTCNTVAYAHHVGIVHCDLKPANIMIGKYGETFVLDWGLAAMFERTSTFLAPNEPTMRPHAASSGSNSGHRGGTYGYVSPEQLCTDGPIGPPSDVYSLGATLYEILTGQPPFNGHDKDVVEQIRLGRVRPPRSVQRGIPRRLEAICLKAMSLSPGARYITAKHLAEDLANWMRDEEVQAAPDRWHHRLGRFARRHRVLTGAASAILFTVLVAAGLTDRSLKMAAHERDVRTKSEELRAVEDEARAAAQRKAEELDALEVKSQVAERQQAQLMRDLEKKERRGFTIALATFEALCLPLANGEMNNLGVFQQFVERIDEFTAEYLESFEQDGSMRLHTPRVYELRATVSLVKSSDGVQAMQDYQKAEALYEQLLKSEDEPLDQALRLARNHLSQGRLQIQRSEYNEALRLLNTAAAELEKLRKQDSDDKEIQRYLAEAYHGLGEVYMDRESDKNTRDEALNSSQLFFEKSMALRQALVKRTEGDEQNNHIRDLARSLGYLGDLHLARRNIPQAVRDYEESKKLRHDLFQKNPRNPEHRFQYARGLGNFVALERDYRGDLPRAIEHMNEVQSIQAALASDFPEVANFRRDLGSTEIMRAEIYLFAAADDPARADEYRTLSREAANKASEIFGDFYNARGSRTDPDGKSELAQSLVTLAALDQAAKPAECLRQAKDAEDKLKELGPEATLSRSDRVTLALARSLQGEPEPAYRALKEAVERGENTAERFERHAKLGLRSLADDPTLGPEFKKLCEKVRKSLTVE